METSLPPCQPRFRRLPCRNCRSALSRNSVHQYRTRTSQLGRNARALDLLQTSVTQLLFSTSALLQPSSYLVSTTYIRCEAKDERAAERKEDRRVRFCRIRASGDKSNWIPTRPLESSTWRTKAVIQPNNVRTTDREPQDLPRNDNTQTDLHSNHIMRRHSSMINTGMMTVMGMTTVTVVEVMIRTTMHSTII